MLDRLARAIARFPLAILLAGLIVGGVVAVYGASAPNHLKGGGFLTDDAESSVGAGLLGERYHVGPPNFYILVSAHRSVDDPDVRTFGITLTEGLEKMPGLTGTLSYWTAPEPLAGQLKSSDGTRALVGVQVMGTDADAPAAAATLAEQLSGTYAGIEVTCGGYALIGHQIDQQARSDLIKAEAIAVPITALILVWAFGGLVAAMVPLVIGLFAVAASLAILRLLASTADVSVFALNMVTALSLALAIDYSLIMVTRFREELGNGLSPSDAMRRTLGTAGRTVLFAAVTVACGLAALAVFPQYFLRTFAYAGLCVVASSAIATLLLVPAILTVLGPRIDALDLRRLLRRPVRVNQPTDNVWYRTAARVSRRPGLVATVLIGLLAVAVVPFADVEFGVPDDRVIAADSSSRVVGDIIRDEFSRDPAATAVAILPDFDGGDAELADYARRLSTEPQVSSVISRAGTFILGNKVPGPAVDLGSPDLLFIQSDADPYSEAGADQIRRLREIPAPAPVLYTGAAATNVDLVDSMKDGLPKAALLLVIGTFALLYWLTRSVVVPLKALVLNALSLAAAFGVTVWIFQEGNFAGLLNITATGYVVPAMGVLMFCLAFGMSMDYEVFVLSRIREAWLDSNRDAAANREAVSVGIGRSGRIVTVAALLMATVFAAMVTSSISLMQMFGLGLAIMALADAILVRSLLVPAVMNFLGPWNWWPHHRPVSSPQPGKERR